MGGHLGKGRVAIALFWNAEKDERRRRRRRTPMPGSGTLLDTGRQFRFHKCGPNIGGWFTASLASRGYIFGGAWQHLF